MILTILTTDQFKSTMSGKMINVTDSAEPTLNIWPYVEVLTREGIVSDYVFLNNLVESVHSNHDNSFHHVLLPTSDSDIFIVIIINIIKEKIEGHYKLDLKKEYGLE